MRQYKDSADMRALINWRNSSPISIALRTAFWLFCACLFWHSPASATEGLISVDEAYSILEKTDTLHSVTITKQFDLSKLKSGRVSNKTERRTVTFNRVTFVSPVVGHKEISVKLRFHNCHFSHIDIKKNTNWLGSVLFESGVIQKGAYFNQNTFLGDVKFHSVSFNEKAIFNGSVFNEESEFLKCIFDNNVSFSGTIFAKTARFNESEFNSWLRFQSSSFKDDVSFIKTKVKCRALFNNVMFEGDAEFRLMEMQRADFGDALNMTVFSKLADFRGLKVKQQASFDFTMFKQGASFVNAGFGEGGLSFRNASFRGGLTNLEGLRCDGPLQLSGADIHSMNFYWQDIGEAILRAARSDTRDSHSDPRIPVLRQLLRRLKDLDRPDDMLNVQYHLSKLKMAETLRDPRKPLLEKAWPGFEWLFWGWPTGYGTKPGKIALISLLVWIISVLPMTVRKGLLVLVPWGDGASERDEDKKGQGLPRRLHDPLYWNQLPYGAQSPLGIMARTRTAISFAFAVMFKVRLRAVRYLEPERGVGTHSFQKYFMVLWLLGSLLLALLAVTVANTSPFLREVFGKIIL